jgi:hypothetical protein
MEGFGVLRAKPRAMTETTVSRTLVKSPPELWAELSDPAALGRHLGTFGPIRITRVEPESELEWEGERAWGTVALEPSGWGTKVTLAAQADTAEPEAPPEPPPAATPRWERVAFWRRRRPAHVPGPEPIPAEPPTNEVDEVLAAALDALGSARHRPYSRM